LIVGICVLFLFCACLSCALSNRSDDISRPKGDYEVGRQLSSRPTYGRSRFIVGTCPCYLCGAEVSNFSWDNGSHRRTCAKVNKVRLVLPQPYMVSCPPPPSYDESSEQQAEARVPPSGQWSGFYLQDGEKNFFTMHLSFSSSSNGVGGQCTDKEGKPGLADILGTWKAFGDQQAVVKFEKHYRGGRSLNYEGYLTVGFNRIMGTYSNGSGSFEMDFDEQNAHSNEEQDVHSNEELNALHSNDQHSAWVQPAPISQYS